MRITRITAQVKRPDRYSIFVDGKYAFSLSEAALLDQRLVSGQELDASQLKAYKQLSADDKAYNRALRYVALRSRSVWEVETYLKRRQVEAPVREQILNKLSILDAEQGISLRRALPLA